MAGLAVLQGIVVCLVLWGACGSKTNPAEKEVWHLAKDEQRPVYRYRTTVHLPYEHLGMNTGQRTVDGKPVRVRCATCHHLVPPKVANKMATKLGRFHAGIKVEHDDLTCRTCHNPPRFETFRLSSGMVIPYAKVMKLCGQCHSQQRKDYANGAHGGMNGYWDLNAGPRDRNHCLDCHNPHRPARQKVWPAPRAQYRLMVRE